MRGVVFTGDRQVELRDYPDPTPGPGRPRRSGGAERNPTLPCNRSRREAPSAATSTRPRVVSSTSGNDAVRSDAHLQLTVASHVALDHHVGEHTCPIGS